SPVTQLIALYNSDYRVNSLHAEAAFTLPLFAGLLGLAGAWLAVGRHLIDIEPQAFWTLATPVGADSGHAGRRWQVFPATRLVIPAPTARANGARALQEPAARFAIGFPLFCTGRVLSRVIVRARNQRLLFLLVCLGFRLGWLVAWRHIGAVMVRVDHVHRRLHRRGVLLVLRRHLVAIVH